ncbi:MAG: hypothetical protein ACYTFZ_04105 [Planctomycetota bacterium]|jgi:hypothetical protein
MAKLPPVSCVLAAAALAVCLGCAAGRLTVVEATGRGLPAAGVTDPGLRRLTALDAAKYVAVAGLVEKVHGVRVIQELRVRDFQFAGQEVEATVAGSLTGIEVVSSEYDEANEIAEVTLAVRVRSHGNAVPGGPKDADVPVR